MFKFNASQDVDAVISPIIRRMSEIHTAEKIMKNANTFNENTVPPEVKLEKRKCVHIIWDSQKGDFVVPIETDNTGRICCKACGQELSPKFDETAVNSYFESLAHVNALLFFGMQKGLDATIIDKLITLKMLLPDAAKIQKGLNTYVAKTDRDKSVNDNIGGEFATVDGFKGITGFSVR